MPAKNTRKLYVPDAYYHIYNRGVEKRNIFCDTQDYGVFLKYLKTYLLPKDIANLQEQLSNSKLTWNIKDEIIKDLKLNNFSEEIELLAYCLMPNHFHLLLHQKSPDSIDKFMNSINTRYVMFFNRKYNRVGHLFQGVYKAVRVETDEQLLYLSAYIHTNPIKKLTKNPVSIKRLTKQPSSLPDYIGLRNTTWVSTNRILAYFSKKKKTFSYEKYILGNELRSIKFLVPEIILD